MALFSRRVLHRVLVENSNLFLTAKQASDLCKLLNTVRNDYLATEWEQVILNVLSKVGTVSYEPNLGGRRKPDVQFSSTDLEFVADITAVSDRGLNSSNPVDVFQLELARHLRKHNLVNGGFGFRIDSLARRGSESKIRLALPKQAEFGKTIFNTDFREFLLAVKAHPENKNEYHVVNRQLGVHIFYHPDETGAWGQYLSYNLAFVVDDNPVFNALKAKGDQLKQVNFQGLRGIFLCDGGCHILRSTRSSQSFDTSDIVREFLRQFRSVGFVLVLTVRQEHDFSLHNVRVLLEPKLYFNRSLRDDHSKVSSVIQSLCDLLPRPVDTPERALNLLEFHKGLSGRHWGRLTTGGKVKISARAVLEMLAGAKSVQEFEKEFGMNSEENPFRRMLNSGRLIKSVTIESKPDQDDDVAIFEFGEPDPAVGPFKVKG
jgi:hypothetical protein